MSQNPKGIKLKKSAVAAITKGRKTQIRYAITSGTMQKIKAAVDSGAVSDFLKGGKVKASDTEFLRSLCPYGRAGGYLCVRQGWQRGGDEENRQVWLKIKNVRVQRLHTISTTEVRAEGITPPKNTHTAKQMGLFAGDSNPAQQKRHAALIAMRQAWTGRGDTDWSANPWVWVIEFEQVPQPQAPISYNKVITGGAYANFYT